jgi:uncharacterized protein (TIGR04551 family)
MLGLSRFSRLAASLVLAAPLAGSTAARAQDGGGGGAGGPRREPLVAPPVPVSPASRSATDGDKDEPRTTVPSRPSGDGNLAGVATDVFSEEWWGRARPIVELHGYLRTRGELFHNFSLGRHDTPLGSDHNLWRQPLDNSYTDKSGQDHPVNLCGGATDRCQDKSQASANMRFRINPELHISDNLRILAQIDALDNLVLGSTPDSYAMMPASTGYASAGTSGYYPLGFFSSSQGAPTAGVNSTRNSVEVKRAWGEYQSPIGMVRFGRMPTHWGLGMVANAGNGIDSDYQTNDDRIQVITGIKSLDLLFGASWDFVSSGPTSATAWDVYGGQPYNTANLANVDQWSAFIARRAPPEMQKLALSRGELVINGGIYAQYRRQLLDVPSGQTPLTFSSIGVNNGLERRGARAFIPDVWLQVLWKKFRFEAEFAAMYGDIEKTPWSSDSSNPISIRMYGLTTQTEFRAVEDRLRLQFGFGWASGDPWVAALNPSQLQQPLNGTGAISTFRFHPDYRVDLIFFRHILNRIQGAYYFRPSVDYDFMRSSNGQKLGGGAAIIWSRASEFIQTPGHKRDLGVELDAQIYYQAKDGSLNDDPSKIGGFYAMLQYGVFFPMGGLSYLPSETANTNVTDWSTSAAQTVRLFLGIAY